MLNKSYFCEELEKGRLTTGAWATRHSDDFGMFFLPTGRPAMGRFLQLKIIVSQMEKPYKDWQHVSVSLPKRCPTWQEMERIKQLVWGSNTTVVQFHPEKNEYVNNHPHCLHMWRHIDGHMLPPAELVGIKKESKK